MGFLEEPKNVNYAASIQTVGVTRTLEKLDNLVHAFVAGSWVIVSKDAKPGDVVVYFPIECALSSEYLSENSLYRLKSSSTEAKNKGKNSKGGFFEPSGRVKALKLKGHKSEGYAAPLESLLYTGIDLENLEVGMTFDKIGKHEICKKYVVKEPKTGTPKLQTRTAKLADSILPNQFRFHPDTENLRRNLHKINPEDTISVSVKYHGTSVIVSKPLTLKKLAWHEKLLRKIGVRIQEHGPGFTYSSRKVIKAVDGDLKAENKHYYTQDIWGIVASEVRDKIPDGYTLYGEIVGYTPDGSPIQGGYHYGCDKGEHDFYVYRVTVTNSSGLPLELSWEQMQEFCELYGFKMVDTLYRGIAKELVNTPDAQYLAEVDNWKHRDDWRLEFLSYLEKNYVDIGNCPLNKFEVPYEGIVIRKDGLHRSEALKLKQYLFLEAESKELDKGTENIEDSQQEEV